MRQCSTISRERPFEMGWRIEIQPEDFSTLQKGISKPSSRWTKGRQCTNNQTGSVRLGHRVGIRGVKKRIAQSELLNRCVASLLYFYVRFCYATTQWKYDGFEEMDAQLLEGQPVMIVMWHERLWMSPYMYNTKLGKICAITTESRIAQLGHLLLRRFDFEAEMIDPRKNPLAFNRRILRRIRNGYSIAVSPDGTRGPRRECKSYPIKWVRKSQVPVFCVAFSMRRSLRLPTWDRSRVPLPFNRGALLARRWRETVPKNASQEQIDAFSDRLGNDLNAVTLEADQMVGPANGVDAGYSRQRRVPK